MNKTIIPLVGILIIGITGQLLAADMVLSVSKDQNIVLKEDNTWVFENQTNKTIDEDYTVTLNDNRIVLISADNTWRFIEKAELEQNKALPVKRVTSQGTAQHLVFTEACAVANKKAIDKATQKLKLSLKGKKLNYTKLRDCVRRVEKDIDTSNTFTNGKGWHVKIGMVLDEGSIRAVLDCAETKKK